MLIAKLFLQDLILTAKTLSVKYQRSDLLIEIDTQRKVKTIAPITCIIRYVLI